MATSYNPYYSGGWQSGEEGGTPITPAALNHMDEGIADAFDIAQSASDVIDNIATRLNITGADDTWSEIYSKLSLLPNRGTATLFIMNLTAASLLTDGKVSQLMAGTVVQSNTGVYEFLMKHIGNSPYIYTWRIEGLTSADATPTIMPVYRFTGTAM